MHACMYACMHACMLTFIYVYVYIYIYACIYICMHVSVYNDITVTWRLREDRKSLRPGRWGPAEVSPASSAMALAKGAIGPCVEVAQGVQALN